MIIGIDIGVTGAVAVLDDAGLLQVLFDMPVMASGKGQASVKHQLNARSLYTGLRDYSLNRPVAYVEALNAHPDQGRSSIFSLGESFGTVKAVLACLGIPYEVVHPATWKKAMGLAGVPKAQAKEASRTMAIQLYPFADLSKKRDHNRAESILIARWGWKHGATPIKEGGILWSEQG
jgi:crossover junction endodeoxyribonuclease RuvC